jgi:hypothetical protein
VFMVFGTPGSSVAALDSAAVPWVEQHLIVPGDYNGNGTVDAADYVIWRKGAPLQNEVVTPNAATTEDYTEWRSRFGNPLFAAGSGLAGGHEVPEPMAWPTLLLVLIGGRFASRTRRNHTRVCSLCRALSSIFNGAFQTRSHFEGDSP